MFNLVNNVIFLDSEEFKAKINQLGQVEIHCSAEIKEKFQNLVLAAEIINHEYQKTVIKLANEVKQHFELLLLDLGEQIKNLKINEPSSKSSSKSPSDFSCNWRALRRKQIQFSQQQLQQVRLAQGVNNRHWVKHRRRY